MKLNILVFTLVCLGSWLAVPMAEAEKPKILYVNSYHAEYPWSLGVIEGLLDTLNVTQNAVGQIDNSKSDIQLKLFHMDTKRNLDEDYIKASALQVKGLIERWQPDAVITADDNAFKYLVVPYFRDSEIPFIFCGMNGGTLRYEGIPYNNLTGITEVSLTKSLIDQLSFHAKGPRIGFLSGDLYSDRAEATFARDYYGIDFTKEYYVESFSEWKRVFFNLQHEVDMFIWTAKSGIEGWNDTEALQLINEYAAIPYGTVNEWMMPFELIGVLKSPQEQGEWAANAALRIVAGEAPSNIPIATNKKGEIHLNLKLAKTMGVKFPVELLQNAHLISAEKKKLLYVNSYHKGLTWSDDIEKGLRKALGITMNVDGSYNTTQSDVLLKTVHMDTKRNHSNSFIDRMAQEVKKTINEWKPDIVVMSDDNATKYVLVPFYKNSDIPFVFCGVNNDASMYGLPVENVTGMIEISFISETIEMLKNYAQGNRVGFIGMENFSHQKDLKFFVEDLGIDIKDGILVQDFEHWKSEYLKLQSSVDLVVLEVLGIPGWDQQEAKSFIMENTRVPSGTTTDISSEYAMISLVKIAEEQGWWAGNAALKILAGTAPIDIPITKNEGSRIYINMNIANLLGIKLNVELLNKATLIE